jgi:branched-chain amino acid transport system substrate-binding protein
MKKLLLILLIVAAGLTLVIPGFIGKVAQAKEPKILKMGFALTITGFAADWFIPMLNGLQMEADRINAKGGIAVGGDKYLIKIIKEDPKFTSEGAKAAAEKLVYREKVKFVWGAGVSHTTMALQEVTKPNKVINISNAWERLALSGEKEPYKYTFKAIATPPETIRGIWKYIKNAHPQVKRVGVIEPNTMSAHFGAKLGERLLPRINLDRVYSEFYESGMKDFYPILSRLLGTKPDVIWSSAATPPELGLIIKQAREMGYKGLFMQEIPASTALFTIAGKENSEGLVTFDYLTYGPNATPEYLDFRKRYLERYGNWWQLAPVLAQILDPLLEAIQVAGTVEDTDKVVEALTAPRTFKSFGLEGRFGGAEFYGIPHKWAAPLLISEVIGGEFTAVGTISVEDQLAPW